MGRPPDRQGEGGVAGRRNVMGRRYALVIDLTIQGVASLLIGTGLGWWLTEEYGAPVWVFLICIILGLTAAVLTMVRYQRRLERLDGEAGEGTGPGR